MSALETMKAKIAEIDKLKNEMLEDLRHNFHPIVKPILDKLPENIKTVGWVQYSPYFNDGEECTFSVRSDMDYGIRVNGKHMDDYFYNEVEEGKNIFDTPEEYLKSYAISKFIEGDAVYKDWIKRYPEDNIDNILASDIELYKTLNEFSELIESIDEDTMQSLFGNHVEVTVNRTGTVETEQYEHD